MRERWDRARAVWETSSLLGLLRFLLECSRRSKRRAVIFLFDAQLLLLFLWYTIPIPRRSRGKLMGSWYFDCAATTEEAVGIPLFRIWEGVQFQRQHCVRLTSKVFCHYKFDALLSDVGIIYLINIASVDYFISTDANTYIHNYSLICGLFSMTIFHRTDSSWILPSKNSRSLRPKREAISNI